MIDHSQSLIAKKIVLRINIKNNILRITVFVYKEVLVGESSDVLGGVYELYSVVEPSPLVVEVLEEPLDLLSWRIVVDIYHVVVRVVLALEALEEALVLVARKHFVA